jgi:hypothetical protein
MSLSLFFLIILSSALCFAYPSVGDKVTWTGQIHLVDGSSRELKVTKEVTSFDKESKQWHVKVNTSVGDKNHIEEFLLKDLYSPTAYKEVMANCQKNGGAVEELKFSIGTYKTCKISSTMEDGTFVERWWGDIPFGVVSKNTRDMGTQISQDSETKTALVGL